MVRRGTDVVVDGLEVVNAGVVVVRRGIDVVIDGLEVVNNVSAVDDPHSVYKKLQEHSCVLLGLLVFLKMLFLIQSQNYQYLIFLLFLWPPIEP